jgi:hypothetical protein
MLSVKSSRHCQWIGGLARFALTDCAGRGLIATAAGANGKEGPQGHAAGGVILSCATSLPDPCAWELSLYLLWAHDRE